MKINHLIDHTLLKSSATQEQIIALCQEAKLYHFPTVCIQPYWVALARQHLIDSSVKVCTVVGFPLGANTLATKVFESSDAIKNGAGEIDMVINISKAHAGDWAYLLQEMQGVVQACKGTPVKVILETCLLSDEQITKLCAIAVEAGVAFVKTSTGFSTGGATVQAVALMHKSVAGRAQVKASGGIRNLAELKQMVDAGATRIGTSAGVALMAGDTSVSDY
jgi:deoxyribose-phosphate aldolase